MILAIALSLGGCVDQPYTRPAGGVALAPPGGLTVSPPIGPSPVGSGRVALLVPITGARAELGSALGRAAALAASVDGAPPLDLRDTAGTPDGAARAAREAVAAGSSVLLGPLTGPETAAAAPVAQAAGIPVLAFTNDATQARPGVWALGLTPDQQVTRLVAAARAAGKARFAALVPDTEFGRAMADSLRRATAGDGDPARVQTYGRGMASVNAAVRELSDYGNRRGPLDAQIRAARAKGDAGGRREAAEIARRGVGAAPFDALLLADTGEALSEIASLLPYYDIPASSVRIMGPALWAIPGSGATQFAGAWYAAPDPAARTAFADAYMTKYGAPAPTVSDIAFDAASIARVLSGARGGVSPANLTQPAGFAGADGVVTLLPDGSARRGLAVFEVGTGRVIEPAPTVTSASGS